MVSNGGEMDPERVGEAIRKARGSRSQGELAHELEHVPGLTQSAISEMEHGRRYPTLVQMAIIEQATGREPGFILAAAGYLPAPDVRWMISTMPQLDGTAQRIVLAVLETVLSGAD